RPHPCSTPFPYTTLFRSLLLLAALFLFVSARSQKTGASRLAVPDNNQPLPRLATGVAIALCAAKFLLHAVTSMRNYGYFRDELYYLDMARHLDWGYVDAAGRRRPGRP